jgi:hypothetical protein
MQQRLPVDEEGQEDEAKPGRGHCRRLLGNYPVQDTVDIGGGMASVDDGAVSG